MTGQNITVAVHLDTAVFAGKIAVFESSRLSDFLNAPAKFLRLAEGSILKSGGDTTEVEEFHINKEAIKILRTVTGDAGKGIVERKKYPFVQKLPVRTKIYIAGYEITGDLHCRNGGAISNLLEQDLSFLPCTDVTIINTQNGESWNAEFAAVNRTHVYAIQKTRNPL